MRQWKLTVGISEALLHRLLEAWHLTSSSSSSEAITLNMLNVICKISILPSVLICWGQHLVLVTGIDTS